MKFQLVLLALGLLACQSRTRDGQPLPKPEASTGAAGSSRALSAGGAIVPTEAMGKDWLKHVEGVLNPNATAYYTGPVGAIHGTIRVKGDPVPLREAAEIPVGKCFAAHKELKSLFRAGAGGELADVLVAATGYKGLLPPVTTPFTLHTRGCAFDQQTVAVMFGQEILTQNHGPEAASPQLVGAPSKVLRFAVPGGHATPVRPDKPGHFILVDRSNPFNTADIYALHYPTATVTDLQGKFEIQGIPVGEVTLDALLPSTKTSAEQKVTVIEGKSIEVNLELTFSLGDYQAKLKSGEAAVNAALAGSAAP